ncbi:hypothetical protein SPHINGO391_80004 [Sphingomonas aurantiaca]|uniref:Uncharacterized protein n=1 Tax=Sphingomonas aurantiaca TaxID=185949 RepID=A0A5E8AU24_9SPHN|nr:hypothetical protein SPHINGO391_80004 [Sphingomonas aurantiaca]
MFGRHTRVSLPIFQQQSRKIPSFQPLSASSRDFTPCVGRVRRFSGGRRGGCGHHDAALSNFYSKARIAWYKQGIDPVSHKAGCQKFVLSSRKGG